MVGHQSCETNVGFMGLIWAFPEGWFVVEFTNRGIKKSRGENDFEALIPLQPQAISSTPKQSVATNSRVAFLEQARPGISALTPDYAIGCGGSITSMPFLQYLQTRHLLARA
jgi:hypothetical protein